MQRDGRCWSPLLCVDYVGVVVRPARSRQVGVRNALTSMEKGVRWGRRKKIRGGSLMAAENYERGKKKKKKKKEREREKERKSDYV